MEDANVKKIIGICLMLLLIMSTITAFAEITPSYDGVAVSLRGALDAPEGTVVSVIVTKSQGVSAPYVTAEAIKNISNTTQMNNLIEYIGFITLGEGGAIPQNTSIALSENAPSGNCAVYINYIGSSDLGYIYDFSHVNAGDIRDLVDLFDGDVESYPSIFENNVNVSNLTKIGANITSYNQIENKTDFYSLLHSKKPFESDSGKLVKEFNECVALRILAETADGEKIGKLELYNEDVWNIELGDESDFASLSEETQKKIAKSIASSTSAADLEKAFLKEVSASFIKEKCSQRTDYEEILENDEYAAALEFNNSPLKDGTLDIYKLADVYTYIIANMPGAESVTQIVDVIETAIENAQNPPPADPTPSPEGNNPGTGAPIRIENDSNKGNASDKTEDSQHQENTPTSPIFNDVAQSHWAYDYIKTMFEKSIVSGRGNGEFSPEDNVKREEFVKMIVVALGLPEEAETISYSDVEKGAWYQKYINAAVSEGYIKGISEESFGIGSLLSRQDAAVILARVLESKGVKENLQTSFIDEKEIADYAKGAINSVAATGIFKGDNKGAFNPKNNITRAETCAIIYRLLQKIGG